MKKLALATLVAACLLLQLISAGACPSSSPDGIGKFHMGREIAKVMGHEGIDWLERDSPEDEEASSRAAASV